MSGLTMHSSGARPASPGLSDRVWRSLLAARQACLAERPEALAASAASVRLDLDERFCRTVARHYDRAPLRVDGPELREGYAWLKRESLRQYHHLCDAGLRIEPWRGPGQPYHGSRELLAGLSATGVLYVYLTSTGHGPDGSPQGHPLAEPSGVWAGGVEFAYNDIFRAVHDLFGHALHAASMGPAGELCAAYRHMMMYPAAAHPVLFTEQVAQICWFFFGPHLVDRYGRLPRRGEPGWMAPDRRPYPQQKVFPSPPAFVARFKASFSKLYPHREST